VTGGWVCFSGSCGACCYVIMSFLPFHDFQYSCVQTGGGGARGLSLMYCLLLFISFGHIPIPFYTDSKADKPPAGWQFFFSFRLFFLTIILFYFPFSSFLPHSASTFPPPLRVPFPSIPPPIPMLYVRIAAPERKENREPRWGSRINFSLERASSHTRKADVTGGVCCVMPWYGTVRAAIRPVRIMS